MTGIVCGCVAAVCALGWIITAAVAHERHLLLQQARTERDVATCKAADLRVERDTAVREVSRLLTPPRDDDPTVRLPHWHQFLNPQAAHGYLSGLVRGDAGAPTGAQENDAWIRAVLDAMEQQFQDGAS
jgi:hypothetical protein